ncbi:ABC transporter substrate-binding protein [Denitrobaculum tricleocarpae]|nr:ABC transporter substrate-binding protein [Denitrobaculum tricleocarpae]
MTPITTLAKYEGCPSDALAQPGRNFRAKSPHATALRKLLNALGFFAFLMPITGGLMPMMAGTAAAESEEVAIAYISQIVERPPKLSNLDIPPEDEGLAGGLLSIKDNNTTGRFMKQAYALKHLEVPADGDVVAAFDTLRAEGLQHFVLNVPADALLKMADHAKDQDVLLFNAGARDDRLRGADCRANVLHIIPSRAMLADALAQFLAWKRWRNWFLVVGRRDSDARFAKAIRRSAKRFGTKIVAEKNWDYGPDARRTAQAEVPAFTQDADYDVLVVADEIGEFGEYLAYRTWDPRPIVGTQGLTPTTWHRTHEQWGAAQLQSRFLKTNGRFMAPLDYHVWAAIRTIGEGATRTQSTAFADIEGYIRSPDFELAGFKGQKLTFRTWNGQLRQPILLTAARALVSTSPQQGFLHERSLLDTMGLDEPESECRFE